MSLPPSQIGPYIVEGEVGRGGMGVVYRARDSRLGRAVAVKALPEHLAQDPDRLSRFEREARTLASLSHPNIAGIHGLEVDGSHRFLVLEFIEGPTLSSILERGPLPVDEALDLGAQIAEALEAAHEKGVVHRDLKPGNVMVTPEGVAKVLDFGLARTGEGPASSSRIELSPDSPTLERASPVHSPTIPGAIMGTAGYMSPEQARGRTVDKRSDIFSFGCVLYEMLTGVRPFAGDTVADVLGATLHKDLDLSLLPPSTPPRVRELLTTCLEKDRRNRLHDMGDARIALRKAIDGREWVHAPQAHASVRRRPAWPLVAMGVVGALALAGGAWVMGARSLPVAPAPDSARLIIPSSTPEYRRASRPVISPDGTRVVFWARSKVDDRSRLWVRPLDSFVATPVPDSESASNYFWSWDGRSIGFFAENKLWAVDLDSRVGRRLLASEAATVGAAWGPKGDILLAIPRKGEPIRHIAPGSSVPVAITSVDVGKSEAFHVFPQFLPDGEHFLYLSVTIDPDQELRAGRLMLGRLGSDEPKDLGPMLSAVWFVEPGWLVYVEDGTIKAVPFDAESKRIVGDAVTVGDGVFYFKAFGASDLSASRTGTIVYGPPEAEDEIVWLGLDGARQGTVGPAGAIDSIKLSPDGSRVAAAVTDRRTGSSDLWIYGVDRPTTVRLTSDARWEGVPAWSRDGSTIYFSWDKSDAPWIYSTASDGSGEEREVYGRDASASVWFAADMSPDGNSLLLTGTPDNSVASDIYALDLGEENAPARPLYPATAANEFAGGYSPDGRWITFTSNRSGTQQVYIGSADGASRPIQVSLDGGWNPFWSPSGQTLHFLARPSGGNGSGAGQPGTALYAVDFAPETDFRTPPAPRLVFKVDQAIGDIAIAPDGKRFLAVIEPIEASDLRVILNGLPTRR